MSDGTNVGTIHLGVELDDIQEKIGEALSKATGKLKPIDAKGMGKDLETLADKATKNIEAATTATLNKIDQMASAIVEKFSALKLPEAPQAFNPETEVRPAGLSIPSIKAPRGPPMKVELAPEVQLRHLEDQLLLIDQKWESMDTQTRRHFDTLDDLRAKYAELEQGVQIDGQKYLDNSALLEMEEAISKAEAKAYKSQESLISLEHAGERVRAKMEELASETRGATAELESIPPAQSSPLPSWVKLIDGIREKMSSLGGNISRGMNNSLNSLQSKLNSVGKTAHTAGTRGGNAFGFMGRSLKQALKRVLVMATLYKAIRSFISYIGSAAAASEGFSQSLNSIKLNLAAAFQPIVDVIIPILNALASALATVTGYIAAFVAMLFGTTYSASVRGAKALKAQTDALKGVGGAAGGAGKQVKELKGALAGFDEINTLSIPDDSGGGGGGGGGGGAGGWETGAEAVLGDSALFDGLKNILERIWGPFKKAWENEGQPTIEAAKFAFKEILGLLAAIGESMLTVWENGTGQLFLESILRTLQNILYTIGLIAQDFKNAWIEDGRGTQIIQNIADGFSNLQFIVEGVTDSIKNVWSEIGGDFASSIIELFMSISGTWSHLTGTIKSLWDQNGKTTFESFLKLLGEIGIFISFVWSEYVAPFSEALISGLGSSFSRVLELMEPLFDSLRRGLEWLRTDGKPILDDLVPVILAVGFALLLMNSPALLTISVILGLIDVINWLLEAAQRLDNWISEKFGWFLEPVGNAISFLDDKIARFGERIGLELPGKIEEGTGKGSRSFDEFSKDVDTSMGFAERVISNSGARLSKNIEDHTRRGTKAAGGNIDGFGTKAQKTLNGMFRGIDSDVSGFMPSIQRKYTTEIDSMGMSTQLGMDSLQRKINSTMGDLSYSVPSEFQSINLLSSKEIDNLAKGTDTSMREMNQSTRHASQMARKVEIAFRGMGNNSQESMKKMVAAVESGMGRVQNIASSTAQRIQSTFGAVNLYSIGQQMINGLWWGVSSRMSALNANLYAMARSTVNTVKRAYGIQSPSKVFDEEVGEMLPLGAARGVKRMTPVLEKALEDMTTLPELEQPTLINVGRSSSAIKTAQEEEQTGIFRELLALFKEMKGGQEQVGGDMHITVVTEDGSVIAKAVIREWIKMMKQGGVPELG